MKSGNGKTENGICEHGKELTKRKQGIGNWKWEMTYSKYGKWENEKGGTEHWKMKEYRNGKHNNGK